MTNQGGLHFTTDKTWAEKFGGNVIEDSLPTGSKIKVLTADDMKEAFHLGVVSEQPLWGSIFAKGYDAILGADAMNSSVLDVIVNPKHLGQFTRKHAGKTKSKSINSNSWH